MSLDTPLANTFSSYQMTAEEQINGQIYSSNQLAVLKNHRANTAQQRLSLDFDVSNPNQFIQDDAFLKGQLSILELLINTHEDTLVAVQSQQQNNNQQF